jgi:hypothetical protein
MPWAVSISTYEINIIFEGSVHNRCYDITGRWMTAASALARLLLTFMNDIGPSY